MLIAAARSAVGHERAEVADREHEHSEHAIGAVDEGEALLLLQDHRLDAGRARAPPSRRREHAVARARHPRRAAASAQCAKRREIAGAAEAAVLHDDRRDARR